jgi:SAM-dependent methyltransferase
MLGVDEHGVRRDDRGEPAPDSPFDLPEDDTAEPWCHRPSEVNMDEPSVARVYDAYLGGAANNRADRNFADRIREILPNVHELAIANRRFLLRGIEYALRQGVDQFIDIGAGVPSMWLTHHIVHHRNPAGRVVYVDHEAVAYQALLDVTSGDDRLGVVRADLRDIEAVLHDPVTTSLIDYTRPVVLVMGLLLHFIPDADNPAGLLTRYRQAVAPGSYLVLSHDTADGREEDMARLAELYAEIGRPLVLRTHSQLARLLEGFELIEPGIVHMPLWHPSTEDPVIEPPASSCVYAMVAKT